MTLAAIQGPSSHAVRLAASLAQDHVAQATARLAASLAQEAVRLHVVMTPWLED